MDEGESNIPYVIQRNTDITRYLHQICFDQSDANIRIPLKYYIRACWIHDNMRTETMGHSIKFHALLQ